MNSDPRRARHETKKAAIVDAAWKLASEEGLNALSLRALAARVGLRQPSLYSYFASKNDLYDAMFADGNQALVDRMEALKLPRDPRDALKRMARENLDFDLENYVRAELMFSRTIPGFEPSPASYAIAVRFDEWATQVMLRAGVKTLAQRDIFVVLMSGLSTIQRANDPSGRRWVRHVDWVMDMFLREVDRQRRQGSDSGPALGTRAARAPSHRADRH